LALLRAKVMALEMAFPLEEEGPGVGIGLWCSLEEVGARLWCPLLVLLPSTTHYVGVREGGGFGALLVSIVTSSKGVY
jgi:hypothetical protein